MAPANSGANSGSGDVRSEFGGECNRVDPAAVGKAVIVLTPSDRHNTAHGRLWELSKTQFDPVIPISQDELEAYLAKVGGAKGISVRDVLEPQQISLPLYVGATSPRASSEVPHWHAEQAEAYFVVYGEADILAKYRWADDWVTRQAVAGTLLIVQPEVCHWFQWRSGAGLALVFKAPQIPGVGLPPKGKVVCQFCPHYRRTCQPPVPAASAA